jgi:predicted Zn-dependent peptidase
MSEIWLWAIYVKDEGGYEIILKSLNHYRNRLKTLNDSPELKESAAMFASVLNQQARKIVPKINEVIEKIHTGLKDIHDMNALEEEKQFLEKALSCYESDIHKAEDTGHEYFVKLIGDMEQGKNDLETIKTALKKINHFSD